MRERESEREVERERGREREREVERETAREREKRTCFDKGRVSVTVTVVPVTLAGDWFGLEHNVVSAPRSLQDSNQQNQHDTLNDIKEQRVDSVCVSVFMCVYDWVEPD